ncbi:MAG: hypothetical protein M3270_11170 [Thermoproteota archaeon]|nr:hypothetical protein [Thermoproteota archaeon]
MVNKTKFSTITAVIATIAAIAAVGSIGGIGLGQQQTALAQVIVGEDEIDVGGVRDTLRDALEDDDNVGAIIGGCSAQFQNCNPETLRNAIAEATGCYLTSEFLCSFLSEE